jgi:hypothetical protein
MINTDGTGLEQIRSTLPSTLSRSFLTDGKHLVFSSNRNNNGTHDTNLFIADWKIDFSTGIYLLDVFLNSVVITKRSRGLTVQFFSSKVDRGLPHSLIRNRFVPDSYRDR